MPLGAACRSDGPLPGGLSLAGVNAPRVRFAPAPTGYLHVGSARSALFNWLYARRHGGVMVLRIEDTDAGRKTQAYVDAIVEPLEWLGIDFDEGPYFQSERLDAHTAAVQRLLKEGKAYFCDLTRAEIAARCAQASLPEGYHGWSREREVADGPGVVVRFRVPDEGVTVIDDIVRGRVEFPHVGIEDFVIRRGDGSPTFLIANAVDDHDMAISHVIRGEDLLNTTPRVVLLWQALGFGEPPVYAHLPLLVNSARKKLSKRRDDVALADFYATPAAASSAKPAKPAAPASAGTGTQGSPATDDTPELRGILPEAMANALALLGWGPPDGVEIRPIAEIVELFSLEAVNRSPAFFDPAKLRHINAAYIRALSPERFVEAVEPWMTDPEAGLPVGSYRPEAVLALAADIQQRISVLAEAPELVRWLFAERIDAYDERSWAKAMVKGRAAERVLAEVIEALGDLDEPAFGDPAAVEAAVMAVGDRLSAELGVRVRSQAPVRVALTGRGAGIPLWQAMTLLGKEACLARLAAARERLAA